MVAVGIGQGGYLSTKMAEGSDMKGLQVLDRGSTEGLRVAGVSSEEGTPEDEAVDGEQDGQWLRVGDICRYVGSGVKNVERIKSSQD